MKKKIIVITGPTASGKTKTAIEAAKKFNAQIISADSRMIYKYLDIVSAKPTLNEREGVIHHAIDIMEPNKLYSAGDFIKYAEPIIKKLLSEDQNIVITGGTWFYITSLLSSTKLHDIGENPVLREELNEFCHNEGPLKLHKKLENLDPKRATEIDPYNIEKVIRAIELCYGLKNSVSGSKREINKEYDVHYFGLIQERDALYEKINKRVDIMVKDGLYEEFIHVSKKFEKEPILFNTIGYNEFYLDEPKTAIEKIKQHTRNFAKRQLTKFNSMKEVLWFNSNDKSTQYIIDTIYKTLKTK